MYMPDVCPIFFFVFVIVCMHVYNLYMRIEQIKVSKGPSYREQNNIDWQIDYAEAVKEYKQNLTIKKVLIEICLMNGRAQFLF